MIMSPLMLVVSPGREGVNFVFWASLVFIVYTYFVYPLWLYMRSRGRPRLVGPEQIFPQVSIIMAVHNEEGVLVRKLDNLARMDYPHDHYEIIVVSDGSTDSTNQILAAQSQELVRSLILPEHQGKASALNHGIQAARGEIIVFTDARQMVALDALRHLVANFGDPRIGCVSGDVTLGDPNEAGDLNGLGLYWKVETKMRQWQGATGSLVGAAGCLYALRKDLVVPLPAGTILDDVYLPLHVARQGARVVYEPRARAWDNVQSDLRREFRRKVRTLMGNYQLMQIAPWLLTRSNPIRFEFVCHKLLRLLVPFFLVSLLLSSSLLNGTLYEVALAAQVGFYALAAMAIIRPNPGVISRLGNVSLAFLLLNAAAVLALTYFVAGKRRVWVR